MHGFSCRRRKTIYTTYTVLHKNLLVLGIFGFKTFCISGQAQVQERAAFQNSHMAKCGEEHYCFFLLISPVPGADGFIVQ